MIRFASLRERALELILARVLRAISDSTVETEILHRDLELARRHILRRIAWRRRKPRSSACARRGLWSRLTSDMTPNEDEYNAS